MALRGTYARMLALARSRAKAALTNRTSSRPAVTLLVDLMEGLDGLRLPPRLRRWTGDLLGLQGRSLLSVISRPDGHIDQWSDGVMSGWAWTPFRPEHRVTLILSAGGAPVATTVADQERSDVRAAGYGDGRYGFKVAVATDELTRITGSGVEQLEVYALDTRGRPVLMGRVPLLENLRFDTLLDRLPPDFVARHIAPWAAALIRAANTDPVRDPGGELSRSGRRPAYRRLMATDAPTPQIQSADPFQARPLLSPYVRYTAARMRKDGDYPIDRTAQAADRLLRWYLDTYTQLRTGYRSPLSPAEIAYLNAPVNPVTRNGAPPISRASLSYYLEDDDLRSRLSPTSAEDYRDFAYWWSAEKAPSLHLEDCLVPDYYLDVLRAPAASSPLGLPLTAFVEAYIANTEGMKAINVRSIEGTLGLYLHLLLRAAQRPDLLRYVPPSVLDLFTVPSQNGDCPFDVLVRTAGDRLQEGLGMPPGSPSARKPSEYLRERLRHLGWDLRRARFDSVDPEGFRVHAAQLAKPTDTQPVDVQVIGPFSKASGLGQACRLAGDIVRSMSYSSNLVDFTLDNPTPEGHGKRSEVSPLRRARINLIHLNAEAIPLAFAYLPDIFSDSYNIGFFYWELDTPAVCHRLGIDLLDEIWVASEFGVSQYQASSRGPVTNVGIAFESVPDIDRGEARAMLKEKYGIRDETFVFMATFDSYSFATRKNPVGTVRAFRSAFGDGDSDVLLVLKTHNRRRIADVTQNAEFETLFESAAADPRILVIDETLAYRDLLRMKKGSDAYVSLHRAEGWGFGPIEAMALGVPVIATAYSGNMEFCNDETAWLVDYEMVPVPDRDYIFVAPGQRWANPSLQDAAKKMRECFEDAELRATRAAAAKEFVHAEFSVPAVALRWESRLNEILARSDPRREGR